jgi:phosphoribosylanthranilate isomerase
MLHHIKICGITDTVTLDACIAIRLGFIGFNFVPQSPRYITPNDAVSLGKHIPKSIAKVALVVNEDDDTIQTIIKTLNPDYLQLHGSETVDRVIDLKQKFNIKIIKAVGIAKQDDIDTAKVYFKDADMILFDAKPSHNDTMTGGLGKKFDWSLVRNIHGLGTPFMLAGGLNYHNILEAKKLTNATYFDICSGVEIQKGIKSVTLIEQLKELNF